jgi:rhodanese-related sulfurtransferase
MIMWTVEQISARDARNLIEANPDALLVCGYEKDDDFQKNDLQGAISLSDFRRRISSLAKDQPIVFYCACPHDETATAQAQKYSKEGFTNVKIIEGGFNAWKEAGYPIATMV